MGCPVVELQIELRDPGFETPFATSCALEQETSPQSTGPEVIKLFSCSAQLRLKFILLINVKMPTIVGILTFMRRMNYWV